MKLGTLVILLLAASCGREESGTRRSCDPGATAECACGTGARGQRVCTNNGTGFGACTCNADAQLADASVAAAVPTDPGKAFAAHMRAGHQQMAARDWKRALSEFEAALALQPTAMDPLAAVAECAARLGDFARASEMSIDLFERAPSSKVRGQALFTLGLAMEPSDVHAAISLYQSSLWHAPNHRVAATIKRLQPQMHGGRTPAGDELLRRLRVSPFTVVPPPTPRDAELLAPFKRGDAAWDGAVDWFYLEFTLTCSVKHSVRSCRADGFSDHGDVFAIFSGSRLKAIERNLKARKLDRPRKGADPLDGVKIRCGRANPSYSHGDAPPGTCDVRGP